MRAANFSTSVRRQLLNSDVRITRYGRTYYSYATEKLTYMQDWKAYPDSLRWTILARRYAVARIRIPENPLTQPQDTPQPSSEPLDSWDDTS
jgi:hypothetical protein